MQLRIKIQGSVLVLVGMVLTACTSGERFRPVPEQPMPPPEAFAHRLATPDVELYWNCTRPRLGEIYFDGIAKNIGEHEVRFLGLKLASVDANDLLVEAAALPAIVLHTDEFSPVQMQLPIRGTEARFDLHYEYPPHPVSRPDPLAVEMERFTAQNVCAATQYPAR